MSIQQLSENLSTYLKDNFSEQDTGQKDQTHEEEDDIQEDNNSFDPLAPFQFTTQGQTVAVCCDERFNIGQVLLPIRPNLAEVTFSEQRGWKTPSNGQDPMLLKRWTANLYSTGTSPSSQRKECGL